MHEYSIVSALMEQCEAHAKANQAHRITKVVIKVGVLSGVEPNLISTAFDTFKLDSICHDAELVTILQNLVIKCHSCEVQSEHNERSVICPHCGSYHTSVLDGEDLILMQLELETN